MENKGSRKPLAYALYALVIFIVLSMFVYSISRNAPYQSSSISNSPSETSVTNTTNIYSPPQFTNYTSQLNNTKALGYNFNYSSFYCGSYNDCILVHTAQCNNNLPYQSACININAYSSYAAHKANMSKTKVMCPYFMIQGSLSCQCVNNYCEEVYSKR